MPDWWKKRQHQLRLTLRRWRKDDGSLIASSMAYYAVLSFFPLMLLLISALGFTLQFSSGAQDAQQELLNLLAQNTAPALAEHVHNALSAIRDKASIGGPIALIALLLASIGIFTHIDIAMARIWNIQRRRPKGVMAAIVNALYHRLRAFIMLLGLGILIWLAFVAGTVASVMQPFVAEQLGGDLIWSLVHIVLSLLINVALLTLLYKLLPRGRVRWLAALRGGILAAILWEISRQALTIVLMGKRYTAYGVVGSLLALMLWIYIASSIFFFAAEYVRVICMDEKK